MTERMSECLTKPAIVNVVSCDRICSHPRHSDPKRAREILREHRRIKETLELWDRLESTKKQLEENQELAKSDDGEISAMASEEIPALESSIEKLSEEIQYALLPADPNEDRDALIEIRAGAGGDEASLFAAELMRAYQRYADLRGWKCEHLESSPSEVGGFKEVILKITGEGVFRFMKYESGVHRVQRVPATETQGRIHTSACTVAVLAEPDEAEAIKINPSDLRIDTYRASGAGGQHINKTDSAVRITHIPTGIVAECQDDRSQHRNKAKALQVLSARIQEKERSERAAKDAALRKGLIGSGDRSDRIRTYNFPQGRLTDHRINLTLYKLSFIMEGDLEEVTQSLQQARQAEQLAELESSLPG